VSHTFAKQHLQQTAKEVRSWPSYMRTRSSADKTTIVRPSVVSRDVADRLSQSRPKEKR
jgi:hypothetical protein